MDLPETGQRVNIPPSILIRMRHFVGYPEWHSLVEWTLTFDRKLGPTLIETGQSSPLSVAHGLPSL